MDSLELRQELNECGQKMRALVAKSEEETRDFSDEEMASWKEHRASYEQLEKRLERAEVVERGLHVYDNPAEAEADDREYFDRKKNEIAPHEARVLTADDHKEGLRSWLLGPGETTKEQQALALRCGYNVFSGQIEIGGSEQRAQSVGTTTAGGFTVADEMMASLSKTMLAFGGVRQACRVVNTDGGNPFPWPTVDDTGNSGTILAENAADGETDVTVGQLVFDAYHVTSDMVRVSFQLLQDASMSWDGLLGELLGERVGRGENGLLTTGTGTAQHNGIVTAATASNTAAAAAAITYAESLTLLHSVDPAWRNASAGWMCNDTTVSILRSIADTAGRPLWQVNLAVGEPATYLGYPIWTNQQMASGTGTKALLFGDLNQYVVRSVNGIILRRSDQRYFENFQTAFIASIRSDGDMIQPTAVKYMTMG